METNFLLIIILVPLLVSVLNIILPRIIYKSLSLLTLLLNIVLVFLLYISSMESGFNTELSQVSLFNSSILSRNICANIYSIIEHRNFNFLLKRC